MVVIIFFHEHEAGWILQQTIIDSFCLWRTRLVVKWRHLVVTFSVEEFSSILQLKSFSLQCSELALLKLDTNLPFLTASNYLVRSKFENLSC